MANDTKKLTITAEPEERVEAALVALLLRYCTIAVEGALSPASEGTARTVDGDSLVSVVVDQQSQDLDFRGPCVPNTYRAQVTVRYSIADDPSAARFREECLRVRAALLALTGDDCVDLGADGFACDEFMIDSTSTTFEGGDNPCNVKTYSATVKGRIINTKTEA